MNDNDDWKARRAAAGEKVLDIPDWDAFSRDMPSQPEMVQPLSRQHARAMQRGADKYMNATVTIRMPDGNLCRATRREFLDAATVFYARRDADVAQKLHQAAVRRGEVTGTLESDHA